MFLPQDLQWLLFEFKIKSTILNMAYKVSQNLGLRVQFLSPLPLSVFPLVAVVLQLLRDAVPFFPPLGFYTSCSLSLENSLLSSRGLVSRPLRRLP